jgi:hypothetical protein
LFPDLNILEEAVVAIVEHRALLPVEAPLRSIVVSSIPPKYFVIILNIGQKLHKISGHPSLKIKIAIIV